MSDLVGNPEYRFSCVSAFMVPLNQGHMQDFKRGSSNLLGKVG